MICSCKGDPIVYAADCAVGDHRRRADPRTYLAALIYGCNAHHDNVGEDDWTYTADAILAAGWGNLSDYRYAVMNTLGAVLVNEHADLGYDRGIADAMGIVNTH